MCRSPSLVSSFGGPLWYDGSVGGFGLPVQTVLLFGTDDPDLSVYGLDREPFRSAVQRPPGLPRAPLSLDRQPLEVRPDPAIHGLELVADRGFPGAGDHDRPVDRLEVGLFQTADESDVDRAVDRVDAELRVVGLHAHRAVHRV